MLRKKQNLAQGDKDDVRTSNTHTAQRKCDTTLDDENYDVHCRDGAL